jgi:hypothetical protein
MAQNLQHCGKASTSPQWTSLGRAIEQGKIEMTETAIEKVSGGRTPATPSWWLAEPQVRLCGPREPVAAARQQHGTAARASHRPVHPTEEKDMANRQQHQNTASTSPWTSLGSAIEQGKIELTDEVIEKVSGGHTPSNAFVIVA